MSMRLEEEREITDAMLPSVLQTRSIAFPSIPYPGFSWKFEGT